MSNAIYVVFLPFVLLSKAEKVVRRSSRTAIEFSSSSLSPSLKSFTLAPFLLGERIVVGAVFSSSIFFFATIAEDDDGDTGVVVSLLLSLPFLYDPNIPTTSLSPAPAPTGSAIVGGKEPPPKPLKIHEPQPDTVLVLSSAASASAISFSFCSFCCLIFSITENSS